jgi:hypothetical protein
MSSHVHFGTKPSCVMLNKGALAIHLRIAVMASRRSNEAHLLRQFDLNRPALSTPVFHYVQIKNPIDRAHK